jgi:diacylglycerol kinase
MRQLRQNESWVPEDIRGTLKINPASHSLKISASRWASFRYAVAGCLHMIRYQESARILLVITVIVTALCIWVRLPRLEVSIIMLTAGFVWVTEFLNTAIESTVNLATAEYHPMARVAKDIGAGATLVASVMSLAVGLLILVPAIIEHLDLT